MSDETVCAMPEKMCYLRDKQARAEGAAEVLKEVAKLPSPFVVFKRAGIGRLVIDDGDDENIDVVREPDVILKTICQWCRGEWLPELSHPDNNCLYIRALAATKAGATQA